MGDKEKQDYLANMKELDALIEETTPEQMGATSDILPKRIS